ncbi:MAG: DegT/DnrJ/EryC1/StrS family aminotransferase [Brevinema sp.]
MIPFIDLQAQYQAYKKDIDERIQNVLVRNDFIMGKDVKELEEWMSKYTGTHAVAVSSGTDALMIPLYAMNLQEGDEIITTPFTFFATAEIIAFLKLTPVFVDIDAKTCNIDISKIEQAITPRTKGIISVSLYGQTPDLDKINEIAQKYHIFHLEDAAQSFGAIYKGEKSCSITEISATSFFPAKPLGTYGDGGMMFFKDENFAKKCASILNQGQSVRYSHQYVGVNARFDTIKAAVLMAKLPYYEQELQKREQIAEKYTKSFQGTTIQPLKREQFTDRHVWAQYTVTVDQRDKVHQLLQEKGIPTAIHYPKPLHMQPALEYLEINSMPIAEKMSQSVLSLPMYPFLPEESQDFIIHNILDIVNSF